MVKRAARGGSLMDSDSFWFTGFFLEESRWLNVEVILLAKYSTVVVVVVVVVLNSDLFAKTQNKAI